MTPELVNCILQQSMSRLQNLELHNVLQWSELDPRLSTFQSIGEADTYLKSDDRWNESIPDTRRMLGMLDPFTGKCLALTSLTNTTVGNAETLQYTSATDKLRYTEFTRFFSSVRHILQFLSFKQGFNRNYY
jgi:hypothetical protein